MAKSKLVKDYISAEYHISTIASFCGIILHYAFTKEAFFMGEQTEEKKSGKQKKHLCIGLLAHVDAGKTTLSEALLYESGNLRKLGRVDHQDAFLDHDIQERERRIRPRQTALELFILFNSFFPIYGEIKT